MVNNNVTLCFYEDEKAAQFYPLTLTRPVHELVCGTRTIKQRVIDKFDPDKENVYHIVRDEISHLYSEKNKTGLPVTDTLFVNSRLLKCGFLSDIDLSKEKVFTVNKEPVAFFVKKSVLESEADKGFSLLYEEIVNVFEKQEIDGHLVNYLWELVDLMPEIVKDDFFDFYSAEITGEFSVASVINGDSNLVYCGEGSNVHPFVVIDTRKGPVVIDHGAEILPHSRIEGPSYIGKNSIILSANIRAGSFIGENCRAGGEVENSVMIAHSNKYHEGFLGHSYIGEWVNLGALTTNSDLKNNYEEVDVILDGKKTNTRTRKAGCYIGDHTKTSIGCLLNTGTYAGVMCNLLASGGLLPRYIPSFSNYARGKFMSGFPLKSLIETAKVVKKRRNKELSDEEIALYEGIFERTKEKRAKLKGRR